MTCWATISDLLTVYMNSRKFYVSFGIIVYVTMQMSLKNLIQACSVLSKQKYHFFSKKLTKHLLTP